MESSCPRFKISSRWTVSRDIFGIYCEEKTNLKKLFKPSTQRFSLTTDTWTSIQRINYMCITAQFIDHEWKLNIKVISFVRILLHKGESIAKALETCLDEWGVKNIFTITVDNALSNDVAIGFMKHKLIRDCIRWVRGSPSRLHKFREFADLLEVEKKSSLCLDVPTRWNSTYMMLRTAIAYKGVFEMYQSSDNSLALEVGLVPLNNDWLARESLVDMGGKMKEKFSKYWGDSEKVNMVIFFANILDPRDKVEYMEDLMKQMYGESRGKSCFEKVKYNFTWLFEEYVSTYSESIPSTTTSSTIMPPPPPVQSENVSVGRAHFTVRTQLKKQKLESGASLNKKSELEVYLIESTINDTVDFDILGWWKVESERFPILSKVARDILAVPISTVASESTFSTGELTNMRIGTGSSTIVHDGSDDDSIPTIDLDAECIMEENEHTYRKRYGWFKSNLMHATGPARNDRNFWNMDMFFFPIILENHFITVVINLKTPAYTVLDNVDHKVIDGEVYEPHLSILHYMLCDYLREVGHGKVSQIEGLDLDLLKLEWQTRRNIIDYDVFMMRHMEAYKGGKKKSWKMELDNEGEE
ncbi:hypothetical protein OSB04_024608 [Centaurea solstitialis]|uniref:Transposase n=1 Tax=Centaurea solstitialis TaxID=347529 RepID=A0AA38SY54_9ASTR|nr:hypothetical protein OSB04_024608 [Centaurea solstitialis]